MIHPSENRAIDYALTEQEGELPEYDVQVDTNTGEILVDGQQITTSDIPKLAWAIRAYQRRADMIERYKQERIQTIFAKCDQKIEQLNQTADFLINRVKGLMIAIDERRLEYPDLGVFRFGTTRESVNDDEYQAMDDDHRAEIQNSNRECFRIKTTVSPDKKIILDRLKSGIVIPGFAIREKIETFEFKPEK